MAVLQPLPRARGTENLHLRLDCKINVVSEEFTARMAILEIVENIILLRCKVILQKRWSAVLQ